MQLDELSLFPSKIINKLIHPNILLMLYLNVCMSGSLFSSLSQFSSWFHLKSRLYNWYPHYVYEKEDFLLQKSELNEYCKSVVLNVFKTQQVIKKIIHVHKIFTMAIFQNQFELYEHLNNHDSRFNLILMHPINTVTCSLTLAKK